MDDSTQIVFDCLQIGLLGLFLMTGTYIWRLRYEVEGFRQYAVEKRKGISKYIWIIIVLGVSLIFKLVLAAHYEGYETDMNCFYSWADMIYENGFGKFYHLDAFTDYPPGYMAILWVVEAISRLFSIETYTVASRVMTKLVPVLADIGASFMLYKIARKKLSEGSSCAIAALYALSPIVLMDSSVWGQTDSVFTLCVLAVGYLCMTERRVPAYFVFVVGAFIKPQTLIFAPILIWTIIEQVFLSDFNWQKFFRDLVGGLLAIASFFIFSLPFGVSTVVSQYLDTMGQYPYASVNAYNIWALLGKNWASQEDVISVFGLKIQLQTMGYVAILAAVFLSGLAFYILKKRDDKSRYFVSQAVVISTMFLFSVRMHERYMFPIIVLLLAAFVVKPTKEMFFTYVGFAFVQFMNVGHVYKNARVFGASTAPTGGVIGITALLTIGLYGYMWFAMRAQSKVRPFVESIKSKGRRSEMSFIQIKSEDDEVQTPKKKGFSIRPTKKMQKFTKLDWIVLISIMFVYSCFALYDLGSMSAPQTELASGEYGGVIDLDLGMAKHVDKMYMYLGFYENRDFTLDFSEDGVNYETVGTVRADSVFKWNVVRKYDAENEESSDNYNLAKDYRYIRLTSQNNEYRIRELVILDSEGNTIVPENISDYPELFDEQELFEGDIITFRSGTYFDEIYHARTAEEMIEGVYCYENTHPPLGKWFISLGVRVFGMTPFGWRIVGVLFGIGMLPLMYLFGRRLFGAKTWAAGALTGLFAFDFMHFSQTRISTIDVYGTFFIIAMFFFMYWYSQTSFYDNKLSKTFIPLGLSAVMMGLGCAAKWTAVYAAAGLGLFFFWIIFTRYREYRLAKKNPTGFSGEIEHQHIIDVFKKNTIITLGFCVVFFVIIAGLIYLLSYIPFSDGTDRNLWDRMIQNQINMYNYHSKLVATHPYQSAWYEWPTMIRPILYYVSTTAEELKEGISAFGNPLVWWAGIPALVYMVYRIFVHRDKKAGFLTFAYAVQYMPWMLVERCTFSYHYFPSVPFVAMMVVYIMVLLDEKDKAWRKWIYVYLGVAFLLFVMFYPVLAGEPVELNYVRDGLKWLPDWALAF